MNKAELMQIFRNNYFLGNYYKLIELWNDTPDEQFGENILFFDFLFARSLVS